VRHLVELHRGCALVGVAVEVEEQRALRRGREQEVAREVEQARVGALRVAQARPPLLVAVAERGGVVVVPLEREVPLGLRGDEGAGRRECAAERDRAVDAREANVGIRCRDKLSLFC
jgi:hypothetical protein